MMGTLMRICLTTFTSSGCVGSLKDEGAARNLRGLDVLGSEASLHARLSRLSSPSSKLRVELLRLSRTLARSLARANDVGSMVVDQVPALHADQVPALEDRGCTICGTCDTALVIQRALELLRLPPHALARRFSQTNNVGFMAVDQTPALDVNQVPALEERGCTA